MTTSSLRTNARLKYNEISYSWLLTGWRTKLYMMLRVKMNLKLKKKRKNKQLFRKSKKTKLLLWNYKLPFKNLKHRLNRHLSYKQIIKDNKTRFLATILYNKKKILTNRRRILSNKSLSINKHRLTNKNKINNLKSNINQLETLLDKELKYLVKEEI